MGPAIASNPFASFVPFVVKHLFSIPDRGHVPGGIQSQGIKGVRYFFWGVLAV